MKKLLFASILITGLSMQSFNDSQGNAFFVSKAEAYGSSLTVQREARERERIKERALTSKRLKMRSRIRMYESKNYETIFFTTDQQDLPSYQEVEDKCRNMDSIVYLDLRWRKVDPEFGKYSRILCQNS